MRIVTVFLAGILLLIAMSALGADTAATSDQQTASQQNAMQPNASQQPAVSQDISSRRDAARQMIETRGVQMSDMHQIMSQMQSNQVEMLQIMKGLPSVASNTSQVEKIDKMIATANEPAMGAATRGVPDRPMPQMLDNMKEMQKNTEEILKIMKSDPNITKSEDNKKAIDRLMQDNKASMERTEKLMSEHKKIMKEETRGLRDESSSQKKSNW